MVILNVNGFVYINLQHLIFVATTYQNWVFYTRRLQSENKQKILNKMLIFGQSYKLVGSHDNVDFHFNQTVFSAFNLTQRGTANEALQ